MTPVRYAEQLCRLNPGLCWDAGRRSSHIKIRQNGRLIGILPLRWAKEGIAANSAAQFRRNGLRLPGGKHREKTAA